VDSTLRPLSVNVGYVEAQTVKSRLSRYQCWWRGRVTKVMADQVITSSDHTPRTWSQTNPTTLYNLYKATTFIASNDDTT